MDIKMTGSSGYLGNLISEKLKKNGHQVRGINRELLYGPTKNLAREIRKTNIVINLAGAPILQRWTNKNKKEIYDSRIITTQNLVKAIKTLLPEQRPQKVISVSAVHIYKTGKKHNEKSNDFGTDFIGKVVFDWEKAWNGLPVSIQFTIFRLAVVLGKKSDSIKQMQVPFKLGIGGKVGSGNQPFPFVHEKDVARVFEWATENSGTTGVFNVSAPQQITNKEFTQALAKTLHRPAFIPVPVALLKLIYGEAASLLSKSPAVIPEALEKSEFEFEFPAIETALKNIFS